MRKFLALPALALAALLGFAAAPASAAGFPLGNISNTTAPLGNLFIAGNTNFSDLFTFTVNSTVVDGQANAVNISNITTFGLASLFISITDPTGTTFFYGPEAAVVNGATTSAVVNFAGLLGGNYAVLVTGTTQAQGGNYSGSAGATVVPIPGAVFLFAPALAGLAGLKRFRRKDVANDAVPAAA